MNDYFQYVHNLKGHYEYDRFRSRTRNAIVSLLLRPIDNPNELEKTILENTNPEILNFIGRFADLKNKFSNTILSTSTSSYVERVDFDHIECIINLRNINDTRRPNKLFRSVNTLLPLNGLYICRVETYYDRKQNILKRFGSVSGYIIWFMDFLLNRVFPRLPIADKIYKSVTRGRIHSLSQAEILGRLAYCGFDIVDSCIFNCHTSERITYVVARKVKEPLKGKPSLYPVIRLNRICRDGKQIGIYKIRTMHPYSEYIQDYVIKVNGCDGQGKPAKDFRITCWGKILRKYHIDELPQIINMLKGNMKLVGIRPLSTSRFREIPPDLKLERIRHKPGCIPPYISLKMPGDHERIEADRIYLQAYKKSPLLTDIRYFFLAVKNQLFAFYS